MPTGSAARLELEGRRRPPPLTGSVVLGFATASPSEFLLALESEFASEFASAVTFEFESEFTFEFESAFESVFAFVRLTDVASDFDSIFARRLDSGADACASANDTDKVEMKNKIDFIALT